MQISTKVSTQVILSQDELKAAAIEFVKTNMEVPTDAAFEVDFADDVKGDLTAIIDITGTISSAPAPKAKASTRAAKATPAQVKPAEAADTATQANISASPEDRQDPDATPPFEVDPEPETQPEPEAAQAEEPAPAPAAAAANDSKPATPKIFPDTSSSAPVPPKAEEDPTVKAKSLFANLTRPN